MYNEARGKLERAARIGLPGKMPDDPAEGMEESLCGVVFSKREVLVIEDFRKGGPVDLTGEMDAGFYSYLGIPIRSKGQTLGTLCGFQVLRDLFHKMGFPYCRRLAVKLDLPSKMPVCSSKHKVLNKPCVAKMNTLLPPAEIGRLVTSTLDLDTLFSRTVNLINERFGFYHVAIFTIEETGFTAILKSATGLAGEEMVHRRHSIPVGSRSIVGTVSSTGNSLVVNNTAVDPIYRVTLFFLILAQRPPFLSELVNV